MVLRASAAAPSTVLSALMRRVPPWEESAPAGLIVGASTTRPNARASADAAQVNKLIYRHTLLLAYCITPFCLMFC